MLVAIPKAPSLYSPITNYENAKKRQALVLNMMYKNKVIAVNFQADPVKENSDVMDIVMKTIDIYNELNILTFELDDENYQLKNCRQYFHLVEQNDKSKYEVTSQVVVKPALFGIVNTPNNEIDYI